MADDESDSFSGSRRLAHLEASVAALDSDVSYIRTTLDGLVARSQQPVNWGWIITAVVTMAGFVSLVVAPLQGDLDQSRVAIVQIQDELNDRAFVLGRAQRTEEWHSAWLTFIEDQMDAERARNSEIEKRLAELSGGVARLTNKSDAESERINETERTLQHLAGTVERLSGQVDSIDGSGSRVWNRRPE